jgi:hypothetical protein
MTKGMMLGVMLKLTTLMKMNGKPIFQLLELIILILL